MENRWTLEDVLMSFPSTNRDSFWLFYPSSNPTYRNNLKNEPTASGTAGMALMVDACLVQSDSVRFGSYAQRIIMVVGNVGIESISFDCGSDLTEAYLSPLDNALIHDPNGLAWINDYIAVDALIQRFQAHFVIGEDLIPLEIIRFRALLNQPQGYEEHILNHYCLWDYEKRRNFLIQFDELNGHPTFKKKMALALANINTNNPNFNFRLYIEKQSLLFVKFGRYNSGYPDFLTLYYFMRCCFHHGQMYQDQFRTFQQIEKELHRTFPFAIDLLCCELAGSDILQRSIIRLHDDGIGGVVV
ncbi:hypothetical protein IFM89_039954 [Coptis chinensis]|uniref:Uncharacterized protein n=1 Tax=Coptis chinensis TaxID=261450 RepID=A0A835LGU1_9MAGN|nr:hypothetical protein IFM89_039954 [Coptis chinensis]